MKDNWKKFQLQEISVITMGQSPKGSSYNNEQIGVPLLNGAADYKGSLFRPKKFTNDPTKLCEEGDILLGIRATIGNLTYADRQYCIGRGLASIKIDEKYANKAYIFHLLDNIVEDLKKVSGGSIIKGIKKDHLTKLIINLPTIEEQKEIVEILDKSFESIEKAKANIEKNIENAKELFQSKSNQIFSQAGEGWEETNIGEIGKVSMCKRILKHQTSQTGEIPFYKIGTFGKEPNAYINAETFNLFKEKYSYPKIGDILLSASGTIGRRVIFDGKPAYFQDSNIVWIDNNEEIILNKYLYHFYEFCDWNPSKGATIKRLYNDDLRRIKISYPTCLEKQKEIIEVIEILDNHIQSLLTSYEEELKNLEELKKSILQKAFSGELTNKNKAA